jgi:hypothetical protein
MFELIEIHKELKLFVLKKSFIRKTISNFLLLFLEELIRENKNLKYYYCIYSNTMQVCLQKNCLQKNLCKIK